MKMIDTWKPTYDAWLQAMQSQAVQRERRQLRFMAMKRLTAVAIGWTCAMSFIWLVLTLGRS